MADPASQSSVPPDPRRVIRRSDAIRFVVPLVGAVIAPPVAFFAYLLWWSLSFAVIAVAVVVLLVFAGWFGYVTESVLIVFPPALTAMLTVAGLVEWETTSAGAVAWTAFVLVGVLALTVMAAAVGKRISRRTCRIEWRSVDSERY